jgi:capsular polysaccharide transport system ATP-binding protein
MIAFDRVSKRYTSGGVVKTVLNDVSLTLPPDRNVAIMGPNGAGKSTVMRLIAGSETPDTGRIRRPGRVSWPLGFSAGFNGTMTGLENARFVARIYGQDTARVIAYVEDFAELGPSLRLPIRTYSNGMRARLAFGLSMAIDFDVYLIDEITAVGDEAFRRKCQEVFDTRLKAAQIVMVSHVPATIKQYCDCGLILDRGGVTYHDDIDGLLAAYHARLGPAAKAPRPAPRNPA